MIFRRNSRFKIGHAIGTCVKGMDIALCGARTSGGGEAFNSFWVLVRDVLPAAEAKLHFKTGGLPSHLLLTSTFVLRDRAGRASNFLPPHTLHVSANIH